MSKLFNITYSFIKAGSIIVSFTKVTTFQRWFKPIKSAIHINSLLNTVPEGVSTGVFVMTV